MVFLPPGNEAGRFQEAYFSAGARPEGDPKIERVTEGENTGWFKLIMRFVVRVKGVVHNVTVSVFAQSADVLQTLSALIKSHYARPDLRASSVSDVVLQIAAYAEEILPLIAELRVKIYTGVILEKFGDLLLTGKSQVIILFAHWKNVAIEFHDGFHDVATIVEQVPDNFAGILDLCVCHPKDLSVALRRHRPACLTKFIDGTATPYFWLFFYLALFKNLSSQDQSYPDAFDSTLREFRKGRNRK